MKTQKQDLGKVSLTCNGTWDAGKQYNRLCIVNDGNFASYISKKDVPIGTVLSDERFWQPIANLRDDIKIDYETFKKEWLELLASIQIKLRSARVVVANEEARNNLTWLEVAAGCEVYELDTQLTYILDSIIPIVNLKSWHLVVGSSLGSEPKFQLDGKYELTAERAIADRWGYIIDEVYVSKKEVKNLVLSIVTDKLENMSITIPPNSIKPEDLSQAVLDLIGSGGNVVNNPDEEDITVKNLDNGTSVLKFKDRDYVEGTFNGMGKVILRKNKAGQINILEQVNINKPNTIYVIRYDYDLNGQSINIPNGCVLYFQGGSLKNGKLISQEDLSSVFKWDNYGFLHKDIVLDNSEKGTIEFDWYKNTKWTAAQYKEYFDLVDTSNLDSKSASERFPIETDNDLIIKNCFNAQTIYKFGSSIYPFNDTINGNKDMYNNVFIGNGRGNTCLLFSKKGFLIKNSSFSKISNLCITSIRACVSNESNITMGPSFNLYEYLHVISIKDSCFANPKILDSGETNKVVTYCYKFYNIIVTPGEGMFGIESASSQGLLYYIQDYGKNFVNNINRHYKAMFHGWMMHIKNFSCTYGINCDYIVYMDKDTNIAFAEITLDDCHIEVNCPLISIGDKNEGNMSTCKVNLNNCRLYNNNSEESPLIIGGRLKFNSPDYVGNIYTDCTAILSNNSSGATIFNTNTAESNPVQRIYMPLTSDKTATYDYTTGTEKSEVVCSANPFSNIVANSGVVSKVDIAYLAAGKLDKGISIANLKDSCLLYCSDYENESIKSFCTNVNNHFNDSALKIESMATRVVINWSKYVIRLRLNNYYTKYILPGTMIRINNDIYASTTTDCHINISLESLFNFTSNIVTTFYDTMGIKYKIINLGSTNTYFPQKARKANYLYNRPYYNINPEYFTHNGKVYIYSGPLNININSVNGYSGGYSSSLQTEEMELPEGINDIVEDGDITWTCVGNNAILEFMEGEGDIRYFSTTHNIGTGAKYYDTNSKTQLYYNGTNWVTDKGIIVISPQSLNNVKKISGTFEVKPLSADGAFIGQEYFCTNRKTAEGNTNGIIIYHKGNDVWVDALGRIVE